MKNSQPLLSVIIPTKNRQHTCLYAIGSVLSLNKNDVEIIVQDCSDTNALKAQIEARFGKDERISYEYLDTKPSMTQNWNRAFERATGIYKCGIGDDDAVLPNIYEVATWAKDNNAEAVGHSKKYNYFWPDFTAVPGYASKLVKVLDDFPQPVKIYDRNGLDDLLKKQASFPNMDYRNLPIAYHTLLAGKLIEKLRKKTGVFLDGTSLDVYSGFALGLLSDKYYVFDEPFTLPGACGSSNSNRSTKKNISEHFAEFKDINFDKRIPPVYNLAFTIAESTQKAFSNLGDTRFINLLDLPYLYVEFLVYSFNFGMFKILMKLMRQQHFTLLQYLRFLWLLCTRILSYAVFKIKSVFLRLVGGAIRARPSFPAPDIEAAAGLIR